MSCHPVSPSRGSGYAQPESCAKFRAHPVAALLETCRSVTGSCASTLCWMEPEAVLAAGIEPWTELPIWLPPEHEFAGMHAADVKRAHAAGLRCRPLRDTVADTWAWLSQLPGAAPLRADLPPPGLPPIASARPSSRSRRPARPLPGLVVSASTKNRDGKRTSAATRVVAQSETVGPTPAGHLLHAAALLSGSIRAAMQWRNQDAYTISDDPARVDRRTVWEFLNTSYWSPGITPETVDRGIDNSLVFSLLAPSGDQAGFARAVTDRARFAWLADVFVLPAHRGRGLGVLAGRHGAGPPGSAGLANHARHQRRPRAL